MPTSRCDVSLTAGPAAREAGIDLPVTGGQPWID
jgi:hypothetical protein